MNPSHVVFLSFILDALSDHIAGGFSDWQRHRIITHTRLVVCLVQSSEHWFQVYIVPIHQQVVERSSTSTCISMRRRSQHFEAFTQESARLVAECRPRHATPLHRKLLTMPNGVQGNSSADELRCLALAWCLLSNRMLSRGNQSE